MASSTANTVAAYLAELPADRRKVVSGVRTVIRKHLPKGYQELMGFGMIMYSIPLTRLADTYNGHPLCYVALAAQKNYYALYLMCVQGSAESAKKFRDDFKKAGKKLDMGKSCVRFKTIDDLPLDVIAKAIAAVPVDRYIDFYRKSRKP
jgi:hypothetical protein